MRRHGRSILLLVALAAGPLTLLGQEPPLQVGPLDAEPEDRAMVALTADVEVEEALLEEDLQRFAVMSRQRDRGLSLLEELYRALDAAVRSDDPIARARSVPLMEQVEAAEADRRALLASERTLIERIAQRSRRIALLEQQLAELSGKQDEVVGVLTGTWDVVMMPREQRGTFSLRQSGTLVSGTYELRGGWSGSLQGTLVQRKVYLVRIDSRLGRSMELEGVLSGDGKTIRGTWLNYELAGSEGGTGQWSAKKR